MKEHHTVKKRIMKFFARPKCLTEAIAPVITLDRLMGLRIFEYPRGQPRPLLSLIYLLLLYCLYYSGSFYLEEEYYLIVKLLKLEYFLYRVLNYVFIALIIVKLLLGWWYTKKFEACCNKINEIDKTLRQLGSTINYDRIYFIMIVALITYFTIGISVCSVVFIAMRTHTNVYKTIGSIMTYAYGTSVNSITILEFYLFVKCLQMQFDLVNRLLHKHSALSGKVKLGIFEMQDYAKIINVEQQRLFSTKILSKRSQSGKKMASRKNISVLEKQNSVKSNFPPQFQNNLRNRSQKHNSVMTECQERKFLLQIIKQVHLELCKVSKMVCIIFGIQTACEIGVIIIFFTGALYVLYMRYIIQTHKITDNLLQQTSVITILSIMFIFKIIFLSRICKHAADKGNKTIDIIYSIYGCNKESGVQEEIQQFGIQILQSPVKFSAYGISLDNRVLTMMLKTVTTYLVIMIQVSNSLESNKDIQNI